MDEVKDGITIEATLIKQSRDAWFLDCEGDKHWFPKQYCTFSEKDNELVAPPWILKARFPNEDF